MNAHALQLRMYIVYNCSSKQILLTPFKMSWYQTLEDVISRVVTGFIVSLHAVGTFQNHPPSFFYYCHSYFNLIWPKSIGRGISSDCENVEFFCQNRFRGQEVFLPSEKYSAFIVLREGNYLFTQTNLLIKLIQIQNSWMLQLDAFTLN